MAVVEQLPSRLATDTVELSEMVPVKSSDRILPITDITKIYFERHRKLQEEQKRLAVMADGIYHDNDLVFNPVKLFVRYKGQC